MPPKSKQPKNKQTKSANDKEYANYSMKEKYKLLEYEPNVSVKNSYENWTIRIDDKSKGININSYMNDKLIPYNIYFDPNFQSAWQNEIYNLHLPRNFTDFKSIKIEDVVNGKYLAKSDDATGAKLSVITEKKYCDAVQRLNTFKNIQPKPDTFDFLVTHERSIIKELFAQSMSQGWALATFNDYIKGIRRYIKLMLGDNHELRIKYSVLYGNLDYIYKYKKGLNEADGDDVMYFNDLLKIVEYLKADYEKYYDENWNLKNEKDKNNAFKANMDFLAVASMVWDYPSRSDKWDTTFIDKKEEATEKTTYLVNDGKHKLYWIYKKNVKDIGRPEVVVPLEEKGLEGDQLRLNNAILLSLKLFPRKYLFVNKDINWLKNTVIFKSANWDSVANWVGNLNKKLNPIFPNFKDKRLGIDMFRRSFVTHYYDKFNNNDKRKLVHAMLTSFTKLDTYYNRRFVSKEIKSIVKLEYVPEEEDNTIYNVENNIQPKPSNAPNNSQPVPPKIVELTKKPKTNAERQKKYFDKVKNTEEYKKAREIIENNPLRKIQRVVRELNQGKKSFQTMRKETINEYGISFKDGKYISSLL